MGGGWAEIPNCQVIRETRPARAPRERGAGSRITRGDDDGRRTEATRIRTLALIAAVAIVASGCTFTLASVRNRTAGETSWWCKSATVLSDADCLDFSVWMDAVVGWATNYRSPQAALDAGGTPAPTVAIGDATAIKIRPGATFDPGRPQYVLYDGNRLAGAAYGVTSAGGPPAGFPGDRDSWTRVGATDTWILPVWVIRPYENQPDVFATSHPCLIPGFSFFTTGDVCFAVSHPEPLDILVTNDDGIGAPGIDALVEALRTVPGVKVTIVAPETNQSGTGDTTTPGGAPGHPAVTASGRAATAVVGTPADSVIYGLDVAHLTPDLVISGINAGQNMGPVINASGTVGAARTAVRRGVPAIAISQGLGTGSAVTDFPAGVLQTLVLLENWRMGHAGPPWMEVPNLNIPSCQPGSVVRGQREVPVAPSLDGRDYLLSDCTSASGVTTDDIDAMNKGFAALSDARHR